MQFCYFSAGTNVTAQISSRQRIWGKHGIPLVDKSLDKAFVVDDGGAVSPGVMQNHDRRDSVIRVRNIRHSNLISRFLIGAFKNIVGPSAPLRRCAQPSAEPQSQE
jgi:hypothetical protein